MSYRDTEREMRYAQQKLYIAPCPGCGATTCRLVEIEGPMDVGFNFSSYAVRCDECGFTGPDTRNHCDHYQGDRGMVNAILLWNRRTPLSPEATAKLVAQRINPPKV